LPTCQRGLLIGVAALMSRDLPNRGCLLYATAQVAFRFSPSAATGRKMIDCLAAALDQTSCARRFCARNLITSRFAVAFKLCIQANILKCKWFVNHVLLFEVLIFAVHLQDIFTFQNIKFAKFSIKTQLLPVFSLYILIVFLICEMQITALICNSALFVWVETRKVNLLIKIFLAKLQLLDFTISMYTKKYIFHH